MKIEVYMGQEEMQLQRRWFYSSTIPEMVLREIVPVKFNLDVIYGYCIRIVSPEML